MLNIPSSVKTLFQTDGIHKNFRVHFPNGEFADITNDNVVQESVRFTESLCSQSTFKFGLAEASVLEFETVGIGNMYGMTIEASIEIDCSSLSAADKAAIAAGTWNGTWDGTVFGIPLGTFRVDSCPRDHQSMAHRKVTAYTQDVSNRMAGIPSRSFEPHFNVGMNALLNTRLSDLTYVEDAKIPAEQTYVYQNNVYACDSTGTAKYLSISAGAKRELLTLSGRLSNSGGTYATQCDYFTYNQTFDPTEYEKFGINAAAALDAAGLDLTYDHSGTKIYANNEAMLRERLPWLFSPCVVNLVRLHNSSSNNSAAYFDGYNAINVAPDAVYPILTPASYNRAFTVPYYYVGSTDKSELPYGTNKDVSFLGEYLASLSTNSAYPTTFQLSVGGTIVTVTKPCEITAPTAKLYKMAGAVGDYIKIASTGNEIAPQVPVGMTGAESFYDSLTNFSFAFDFRTMLNGVLELYAEFLKADRAGSAEVVSLDNSAPTSVPPDNYSEMWWDEYDVDPIGTVTITFKETDADGNEQENTVALNIGTGLSRYDMSNNETLKSLANASLSDVSTLINTNFKPKVGAVAFTPIDLTMQGWPWLEAGDALEVEAEDGTIVETYALRIEMSGIQHLQMAITAEGGEIIEEVS